MLLYLSNLWRVCKPCDYTENMDNDDETLVNGFKMMPFFDLIVWPTKKIALHLHHQYPPSLSTMLKCAGRFIYNTIQ